METSHGNSPQSEKKTPKRLIQSTLFPLRSHEKLVENANVEGQEGESGGTEGKGKSKRRGKAKSKTTPSDKTIVDGQEDLTERIESQISPLPNGLQIDINARSAEADKAVVAMSLLSEKKSPCLGLMHSALFPHQSEENSEENNNSKEEQKFRGRQSTGNGKRKRNVKNEFTPDKIPVEGQDQEALTEMIENKTCSLSNGLQIDLNEKCAEEDGVVAAMSLHSERKTPCVRLIQSSLFPHHSEENSEENANGEEKQGFCGSESTGKRKRKGNMKNSLTQDKTSISNQEAFSDRTDIKDTCISNGSKIEQMPQAEELVTVNNKSPHSRNKTPRRRLIQATLLPHQPQENGNDSKNGEERDEEYCENENKTMIKRRGKPKRNPSSKTPVNGQETLCGSTEKKLKQTQHGGQEGADSPEKNEKSCVDLDSGPCKRSRRQMKGKSEASPRKVPTPKKLKGPHCRRIIDELNEKDMDIQSEHAAKPVIDLRLEAKIAAEENARLFMGRQTHPFFSLWKAGKKVQEAPESTELDCKPSCMLHDGHNITHPIHVFEMLQDDPVALDWSNWTFNNESSPAFVLYPENAHSPSFNCSAEPLKLDVCLTASDTVGASFLQNECSLNHLASLKSLTVTFADGQESHHQLEYFQVVEESSAVNSATALQDKFVEDRMKLDYRNCGAENSLWTNKYLPRKASEVCGNGESVRFLNEWLGSWRGRYSRNSENFTQDITCGIEDSDYGSGEDSGAESMEERAELKNVLLVNGPVGSGKSAAIYACANEQGFQVIEVSASDWRHGAHIKQKFGAAMDSHGLNKWSSDGPRGSRMNHTPESSSTQTSKLSLKELEDDVVQVFPESFKEDSDCLTLEHYTIVGEDNSRAADMTLILFEDVDINFEEDRGLIASIQQIAETAKRPMVLTSNSKVPVLPDQLDRLEICFTLPSHGDLFSHLSMICDTEQADINPQVLHRFVTCCQGDIRKTIMLLQYWCQGKHTRKDREVHPTYGPLHFDLEAGYQVMPKVIPWGFPCQLSELVEKEITKSLSVAEENVSLLDVVEEEDLSLKDAVEEEDLSFKEMSDVLGVDVEAKKKAMLSRNYAIHDDNGFSVPFDSLDDFSNSSGSPVAFIPRSTRKGLHTVLSSQSEDDYCTSNKPKDLNEVSGNLLDGFFPDVSHTSLADIAAVQEQCVPCSSELPRSETEIPKGNLSDWPPIEIDEHLCETYKSVDISCVPESSFVLETEFNDGVEFPSNTVSCGPATVSLESRPPSTIKSVESIDAGSLHDATKKWDDNREAIMENITEVDTVSVHREETGDSQQEHAGSISRRYQVMDECSRAGFSVASVSWENPRCSEQASSVPETWRRLRCCHGDLKSYVTSEQRNASRILKFASRLTDLLSITELMFDRCQSQISDTLESSRIPCAEPDEFFWYDEHLQMVSTIAQHGFCYFTKETVASGSDPGHKIRKDLPSEILESTNSTAGLGKLLTQASSMGQNLESRTASEIRITGSDSLQEREIAEGFYHMIQNVVPTKLYLAVKGAAFHEYMSSLGQISKFEANRLSENIDGKRLGRRARVARHYLSAGSLTLTPEDVALLAQRSCFGKIPVE